MLNLKNPNTKDSRNLRNYLTPKEESLLKDPENIFNKITEKNPNPKKEKSMKVQEPYGTPNILDQKKVPLPYNNQNTKRTE